MSRGFRSIKKPKLGPTIGEKQGSYDYIENLPNRSEKDRETARKARETFNRNAYYGTMAEVKR